MLIALPILLDLQFVRWMVQSMLNLMRANRKQD